MPTIKAKTSKSLTLTAKQKEKEYTEFCLLLTSLDKVDLT